jgi:multidrug efflux system outer membrane protein
MKTFLHPRALAVAAAALLGATLAGCGSLTGPAPSAGAAAAAPPAAWQAPQPPAAGPAASAELARWWQQFDDPLLARLIERAQQASPNLAAARSRIEQARAARVASGAALGPRLDAQASALRGRPDLSAPLSSSGSVGMQASWEWDLFGGTAAARDAAQLRLDGAQAQWHDARVSVAAETASAYLALRACEAQLALTGTDLTSRTETARLTDLSARAGLQPPAAAALARASAAQGSANATQLRASCDSAIKGLVALTAAEEPALRAELAAANARLPQPQRIAVAAVPAQALAQRPDLYALEREVQAASADTAQAQAQRLPRVALSGSIGAARVSSGGFSDSGSVWSLGPLSVSLPLFDGGARQANVLAARARYDEAVANYTGRLRQAVREVEDALLALQSTAARGDDARIAAEGFDASYRATEARYKGGLGSLFELEDARRTALAAQSALIDLQRERVAAWISLVRALGGGWSPGQEPETRAASN